MGERGRRVMAVGPGPGEEREGKVGVGEGGDGGGEARVGERGREERGEGAGPGRVGGAGGEDARAGVMGGFGWLAVLRRRGSGTMRGSLDMRLASGGGRRATRVDA